MRILVIILAAFFMIVSACGGSAQQASNPQEARIDPQLVAEMGNAPSFRQVATLDLSYPGINVAIPLHMIGGGPMPSIPGAWQTYVRDLHDVRFANHPTTMEALELFPGDQPVFFCRPLASVQYPATISTPFYCQEKDPFSDVPPGAPKQVAAPTPQTALALLPAGFTEQMQQYANANGTYKGWLLATTVASIEYAQHLQYEMAAAGVAWPAMTKGNQPFHYCIAGISLRAFFPPGAGIDLHELRSELDTMIGVPAAADESYKQLRAGFEHGRPDKCLAPA